MSQTNSDWIHPVAKIENDEHCIDVMNKLAYDIDYYNYMDAHSNGDNDVLADGRENLAEQYQKDREGTIKDFLDYFGGEDEMEDYVADIKTSVNSVKTYYEELQAGKTVSSDKNVQEIMNKWGNDTEAESEDVKSFGE